MYCENLSSLCSQTVLDVKQFFTLWVLLNQNCPFRVKVWEMAVFNDIHCCNKDIENSLEMIHFPVSGNAYMTFAEDPIF